MTLVVPNKYHIYMEENPVQSSEQTQSPMPNTPDILGIFTRLINRLVDKILALINYLSLRARMPHQPLNRKKILSILGGVLLFFLFSYFTIACVATYTKAKIPFLSDKGRRDLITALYNVPLLPKTAEQVLVVAVDRNTKINSYAPDFSFSAKIGAGSVSLASMDFHVAGPVDFTPDKKTSMDLTADAFLSFAGNSYQLNGKLRKIEDKLYFKLDKLPDALLGLYSTYSSYSIYGSGLDGSSQKDSASETKEIADNINKALANWIVYDNGGLQSEARKNLDKGEDSSVINAVRKNTQEFLLKSNTLPEVKRLKDEAVGGVDSYHLSLTPSKALIKKIFLEYALSNKSEASTYYTNPDQKDLSLLANAIDSVQIDAYFGKKDLILTKTSLTSQIKLDSFSNYLGGSSPLGGSTSPTPLLGILGTDSLINARLSISTVVLAKDVNKPVSVAIPAPVKTSQEFMQILTDSFKTRRQKESEGRIAGYQSDFTKIQYYLTRYYIEKGNYPSSLNELSIYIPAGDNLSKSIAKYTYKVSPNNRDFIVYVVLDGAVISEYTTPYYGFSSRYQTTRQLDKNDFDEVTGSPYVSPAPYYSPNYR